MKKMHFAEDMTLKDGQFLGMTVEEVMAWFKEHDYQTAKFYPAEETEDGYDMVLVGNDHDYYADHYEILFWEGVCDESYEVVWD